MVTLKAINMLNQEHIGMPGFFCLRWTTKA